MNQFSDRPFAIGSMFGIRSFRVTSDGVLTGVHQRLPWHDGINEAVCASPVASFAGLAAASAAGSASMAQLAWTIELVSAQMCGRVLLKKRPKTPPKPEPAARPEHDAGTLNCTCGFYAYFDRGDNPAHGYGNMLGIVEGFGVMTVGSRGFRCSKARIRALIVERFEQGFDLAKVLPNYPRVPVFGSIDEALAEFPLTVPEGTPEPADDGPRHVTYTLTVDTRGWSQMFANMARRMGKVPTKQFGDGQDESNETPQERALRLRRERNTGPKSRTGLDGRFRR